MRPSELIEVARALAASERPSQACLRRAASTAYYALFHALCAAAADTLVGERADETWSRVYRAPNHAAARRACTNRELVERLPPGLHRFTTLFPTLQTRRHDADYEPKAAFVASEVLADISAAESVIAALAAAVLFERRA